MKIPIIKYSNKFLNTISPFMNIIGITLYPFIILKEDYKGNEVLINHETIHIKQQEELLVIPFYIFYILEWFIKLFIYGSKAYKNLSFEREANENETNLDYIKNRKNYSFIKHILK